VTVPDPSLVPLPNPPAKPRLRTGRRLIRDVIEVVLLVLLTYTPINLMTARAIVEGPSMQPTFYTGQLVIVNRSAYFFGTPSRGDVIVLHNPTTPGADDLIKRVIGLPNETLTIRKGVVSINGKVLDEPYIKFKCDSGCDGIGEWKLGPDQYFVMGDNRPNSLDSHNFGPISRTLVVGQAWIRYWPLNVFTIISHPNYGPTNASPQP